MPHRIPFANDYDICILTPDDGSLKPLLRIGETEEIIDLASAFDRFLKASTTSRRRRIHEFFSSFASSSATSLELNLLSRFLIFDHSNDDGPTFDDQFSCSIERLQLDLLEEIRQSIQQQSKELVGNAAIEKLLDESELRSRLLSRSAESVVASSLNQLRVIGGRCQFREYGITNTEYDKFESSLAQYQVRRKGLKIRGNQHLVSRTLEEICKRTSALEKAFSVARDEPESSEHSEPQEIGSDPKAHTYARKRKVRTLDSRLIWKHLTISRDETSASNFLHERLLLLFLNSANTCSKHSAFNEENTRNIETPKTVRREQHSGSFATHTGTGAMAEQYSSRQVPNQQQYSVATSPDSGLPGASPFKDPNSSNPERSIDDKKRHGDMRPHRSISSVTSIGIENQSEEDAGRSKQEKWKIINFISEIPGQPPLMAYVDKPVWGPGLRGDEFSLKAFLPVSDAEGYVRQAGFDFSINREYSDECLQPELRKALSKKQPPPEPLHHHEEIRLHSQEMIEALEAFLTSQPGFWDNFPSFNAREPIEAPYIFWYTYRSPEALQQLRPSHQSLMGALTTWIDRNYEDKYNEAKRQLENGVITLRTMPFLLCPGEVLVWKEKDKTKAAITSSLLVRQSLPILYWDSTRPWAEGNRSSEGTKKGEFSSTWEVNTWSYKFDGEFLHDKGSKRIKFKASSLDQEVAISKLGVHPLRFADEKTKLLLETRGKNFWTCRHRNLVSYIGEEGIFAVCEKGPPGT